MKFLREIARYLADFSGYNDGPSAEKESYLLDAKPLYYRSHLMACAVTTVIEELEGARAEFRGIADQVKDYSEQSPSTNA